MSDIQEKFDGLHPDEQEAAKWVLRRRQRARAYHDRNKARINRRRRVKYEREVSEKVREGNNVLEKISGRRNDGEVPEGETG